LIIILIIFVASPAFSADITGWKDAKWGMSKEQVKRVLGKYNKAAFRITSDYYLFGKPSFGKDGGFNTLIFGFDMKSGKKPPNFVLRIVLEKMVARYGGFDWRRDISRNKGFGGMQVEEVVWKRESGYIVVGFAEEKTFVYLMITQGKKKQSSTIESSVSSSEPLASPIQSQEIQGWREAKWGMTKEEVEQFYKSSGDSPLSVNIEDQPFLIRFNYDNNSKLNEIVLAQANKLVDQISFDKAVLLIESKYGEPDKRGQDTKKKFGKTVTTGSFAKWNKQSGTILVAQPFLKTEFKEKFEKSKFGDYYNDQAICIMYKKASDDF
jgi:hypothetical protein